jgi:hypothetical protein
MALKRLKSVLDQIESKSEPNNPEQLLHTLIWESKAASRQIENALRYALKYPNKKISVETMVALLNEHDDRVFYCPEEVEGKLEPFHEQGMEGDVAWSIIDDDFIGYSGLHFIEEGDHLTVYPQDNPSEIVFDGIVKYKRNTMETYCGNEPFNKPDESMMPYEEWVKLFYGNYLQKARIHMGKLKKSKANIKEAKLRYNSRQKFIEKEKANGNRYYE